MYTSQNVDTSTFLGTFQACKKKKHKTGFLYKNIDVINLIFSNLSSMLKEKHKTGFLYKNINTDNFIFSNLSSVPKETSK